MGDSDEVARADMALHIVSKPTQGKRLSERDG
jgi:hypothetical protein